MSDQTPTPMTGRRSVSLAVAAIATIAGLAVGAGAGYVAFADRGAPAAETATGGDVPGGDAPGAGDVVARVNEKAITEKDLEYATNDFAEELARVPEGQRREAVLQALIDLTVIAQEAEKQGLGKNPDFARRMALLRTSQLRSEFVRTKVAPQATAEAVRKRYDEEIAKIDPPEEIKARHILVETEEEAKGIIAELKAGGDFAAIAKAKSKDPGSGANGGDLGFFSKGSMVPEFETAAFALEIGKFTEAPVKSQYGYHIIKVEERRKQPLPQFEAVAAQVNQLVMSEIYVAALQKLKSEAKIEIVKPVAPPPAAGETPMDANPTPGAGPAPEEGAPKP